MRNKFVALLRGINVGGNKKVAMHDLKLCFEDMGFENVSTYINSGNIYRSYMIMRNGISTSN